MTTADGLLPATQPLPSDAICLHIGVHKTGTTALQAALANARSELSELGVLYPGRRQAHHASAQAVMQRAWGWADRGGIVRDMAQFDKVVDAAKGWSQRVVVSSEHYCEASDEVAARIVEAFGRDRLQVVVTLRSLGRLLPSSWQQYLKYGLLRTYEDWLEDAFDDERTQKLSPSFWRRNRHDVIAERWASLLGPEHVTFIVLENVDRSAMFRTFAQLLDVDEEVLTSRMDLTSNRSMTAQESELLRLVNHHVRAPLNWRQYEKLVRYGVARTIVEGREPERSEPRLHTPDWALDEAARRGAEQVEAIRRTGVRVIGDLDLLAERAPSTPPVPEGALNSLPVEVAVQAISALVLEAAGEVQEPSLNEQTLDVARRWRQVAASKVKRKS